MFKINKSQWGHSHVFIVNFEQILNILLNLFIVDFEQVSLAAILRCNGLSKK